MQKELHENLFNFLFNFKKCTSAPNYLSNKLELSVLVFQKSVVMLSMNVILNQSNSVNRLPTCRANFLLLFQLAVKGDSHITYNIMLRGFVKTSLPTELET